MYSSGPSFILNKVVNVTAIIFIFTISCIPFYDNKTQDLLNRHNARTDTPPYALCKRP